MTGSEGSSGFHRGSLGHMTALVVYNTLGYPVCFSVLHLDNAEMV